ncbi:unnamed protein product [Lactuca virosa]|uniref:Uncharacterized protein n=1 Tax=Lactuca virosa TaxID=75947 RepID=A0AAU9MMY9_9ASTR|nr:unnamed protein product [Lactuca virosa]
MSSKASNMQKNLQQTIPERTSGVGFWCLKKLTDLEGLISYLNGTKDDVIQFLDVLGIILEKYDLNTSSNKVKFT